MDVAKSLVKCVARAFYDTKHILVLDALMIHNAVRDDELAKLLGLQTKDLHKLCGKLKEDRMLAVHTRAEQKEGQQRPVSRTYYYVDYRSTIDAVKFRMHGIVQEVEKKMNKDADTKGYVCPHCEKRFTVLDALVLQTDDSGLFICERCGNLLVDDDDSVEVKTSQERLGRLMGQTKKIVEFLKKIDEVFVPTNDFETAWANHVPVPKDKNQLSAAQFIPVSVGGKKNGPAGAQQAALEINITSSSEKSAAEIAAEQLRKQQQAEKNALPVWHTQSTVDPGAITTAGMREASERAAREREGLALPSMMKPEDEDEKKPISGAGDGSNGVQADAIAEYYAALAAQKAKEEAEEAEDDDDDDDDEEEDDEDEEVEFEDLDVGTTAGSSSVATPADGPPPGKRQKTEPVEDSEEEADFEDV